MGKNDNSWNWQEGHVNVVKDHIVLTHEDCKIPIALLAPAGDRLFNVQFFIARELKSSQMLEIRKQVEKSLNFYLVELSEHEPDPWRYAIYHTTTAADMYDTVHWSFHSERNNRDLPLNRTLVDIATCDIFCANHNHPKNALRCGKVIESQKKVFETRSDLHPQNHFLPIPWQGFIKWSPLIFISSNPSILLDSEKTKNSLSQKASNIEYGASLSWMSDESDIIDFFSNRFNLNGPWSRDYEYFRLFPASPEVYSHRNVRYWNKAWHATKEMMGKNSKFELVPGIDFAITEVVHCNSSNKFSIDERESEFCGDRYLKKVLSNCIAAKVFVIIGDSATHYCNKYFREYHDLEHTLTPNHGNPDEGKHLVILRNGKIVVTLPHLSRSPKVENCLRKEELDSIKCVLKDWRIK